MEQKPDFVLIHPPSVYDFRRILLLPNPMADLIPSGSYFDMYPIGFPLLAEYLERHGFSVKILNFAALMLEKRKINVEKIIREIKTSAFGIGLHWMVHCHGALEMARIIKKYHPETPVIFGGYSATIFSRELLSCPEVDYVVRGDSAEKPLRLLLDSILSGNDPSGIPNISYKEKSGVKEADIRENPIVWVPENLRHTGRIYPYMISTSRTSRKIREMEPFFNWWKYPITTVTTVRGCKRNCGFCGGSAYTQRKFFAREKVAFRNPQAIAEDVADISRFTGAPIFVIGDIREGGEKYAEDVISLIERIKPRNQIVLELFEPASYEFLEMVAKSIPNVNYQISPESHDEQVRIACGKNYPNDEMIKTIQNAIKLGCGRFDIFFMIGLPKQTRASVLESISFAGELAKNFAPGLVPFIGPLAPFLDPGCLFYEHPEKFGYKKFASTLEEFTKSLLNPHWRDILTYETRWMKREEIVNATYDSLFELNRIKGEFGIIPGDRSRKIDKLLRENVEMIEYLDKISGMKEGVEKEERLSILRKEAKRLEKESAILKDELAWPVEGKRYRFSGIMRMAFGRRNGTNK